MDDWRRRREAWFMKGKPNRCFSRPIDATLALATWRAQTLPRFLFDSFLSQCSLSHAEARVFKLA
jgi:hypothetical protein